MLHFVSEGFEQVNVVNGRLTHGSFGGGHLRRTASARLLISRVSLRLFFTHCCSCLMFFPQSNRTPLHSARSHPLSVSTWSVELYFCGPFSHHPKPITRTRYLWSAAVFLCSISPSPHLRLRKNGETKTKNHNHTGGDNDQKHDRRAGLGGHNRRGGGLGGKQTFFEI